MKEVDLKVFYPSTKDMMNQPMSDGYTLKWRIKRNNAKSDRFRYLWLKIGGEIGGKYYHQSLGEVLASQLAEDLGIKGVTKYYMCIVVFNDPETNKKIKTLGCYSYDFAYPDYEVIPLDTFKTFDLNNKVDSLCNITGIDKPEVDDYFNRIALLDSIILNDDRGEKNFAVLRNISTGEYKTAPIFDSGECLGLSISHNMGDGGAYSDEFYTLDKGSFKPDPVEVLKQNKFFNTEAGKLFISGLKSADISKTMTKLNTAFNIIGSDFDPKWVDKQKDDIEKHRIHTNYPMTFDEKLFIETMIRSRIASIASGNDMA